MNRCWSTLRLDLLLLSAALAGCSSGGRSACCEPLPAAGAAAGASVFQLDATWQDQTGANRSLRDFAGKPVVMAMVFTHCRYACPAIVADIRRIGAALPPQAGDTQFVLASMDDERDSPQELARFARDRGLDPARFTLLHGDAGAVRELAAAIAMRYVKTANGEFAHSNLITLLDRSGRVACRLEGIDQDPAPLLQAAAALPK